MFLVPSVQIDEIEDSCDA